MLLPWPLLLASLTRAAPGPTFKVEHLTAPAAIHQVLAEDLDGDGKRDLLAVLIDGEGELAHRSLAIFWNRGGAFAPAPDLVLPVPTDVCGFDVADVDGRPGAELLEITAAGVRAQGFVGRALAASHELLHQPTIFLRAPRDALPRLRLAQRLAPGAPASLLVPGPGTLAVYRRGAQGFTREAELPLLLDADLDVPPREDRVHGGAELQAFSVVLQAPAVHVVDVNADGRPDLVLVLGQHLRTFLQRADGTFSPTPDVDHRFEVRTAREREASWASVKLLVTDVDGDGRADVLAIKQVSEGISSASTTAYLFFGGPHGFGDTPDQTLHVDGASVAGVQLADLTGDGHPDLVLPSVHIGLFAIIRMLTSKTLKVGFQLFPFGPGRRFQGEAASERSLTFQLDLKGKSDMQAIDMSGDYDGDGKLDLAFATDADALALYSGAHPGTLFSDDPMATIPVRALGQLLAVDLDGQRRSDLVLWYPSTRGHQRELSVAHNLGAGR